MKPCPAHCRVLLVATGPEHASELWAAVLRGAEQDMTRIFELVYVDAVHLADFLLTLDLLDHIKAGLFDLVCLLPSASTWSRLRHSDAAGQPPLRTRAFPLGLSNLAPPSLQKIRSDNRILESISWCAEQTLLCSKPTSLFVVFPEDLGGHSRDGPTSVWSLREFQVLQGQSETCRGAGFLCQLGQADFRRPMGVLTNIARLFGKLHKGWPRLISHKEDLLYKGPLPNHCPCVPQHQNLRGTDAADHFVSASSHTLGERFWSWVFDNFVHSVQSSSLRDGDKNISTIDDTSSTTGLAPLLAPSLASNADSWRMFYESWKYGNFTPSKAAEILSSDGIAAYFSRNPPTSFSTSSRSTLASLWLLHSTVTPSVPTAAAGISRTTRSRTPRSIQGPLVRLRPRGDGGRIVLTDATRRSLSVRFGLTDVPL